jgi:CNT family concentrative nucleoside transporter
MADTAGGFDTENQFIQRTSISTSSDEKKVNKPDIDVEGDKVGEEETASRSKFRVFVLIGLAALILGWWISSTVLEATRGQWYDILHSEEIRFRLFLQRLVQTIFAWFFLM